MLAYLRRHHIGLLALFIALGGTSYAATLPRNSVGTAQLKSRAVSEAKLATVVKTKLNRAGTPATVTLTQPGKVLVQAWGTLTVGCANGGSCSRQISAQVGGAPPGSWRSPSDSRAGRVRS